MSRNIGSDLRRSQLITPFGVGALNVREDGTSVITAGLDFWLNGIDEQERSSLIIDDRRLKDRLKVGNLYKPPSLNDSDFGDRWNKSSVKVHPIPVLRFPTWFSCILCGLLERTQPHSRGPVFCSKQHGKLDKVQMFQVSYVVICKNGHLDDFPWNEWVHKNVKPGCFGPIFLTAAKSGDLQNSIVKCSKCNLSRSMDMAMSNTQELGRSNLTIILDSRKGVDYKCQGIKPWLGSIDGDAENCIEDAYATFRGAGNVYFPFVESSILIPEGSRELDFLYERLKSTDFVYPRQLAQNDMDDAIKQIKKIVEILTEETSTANWILDYSDKDIEKVLNLIITNNVNTKTEKVQENDFAPEKRNSFLFEEYQKLQQPSNDFRLNVIKPSKNYGAKVYKLFSDINLVASLTETRAFWGFTRLETINKKGIIEARNNLRRYKTTMGSKSDWLPAIQIKGEGLFFKLSEELINFWQEKKAVVNRMSKFSQDSEFIGLDINDLNPKFVLIHTLSHLIMKELIYFCGYSQASLRERLYISSNKNFTMSGFMIYTASGDSEGTLGGLVRMGKPGYLEEVIDKAIENARWCSNDPVCMETGSNKKIGGEESTLACCYACCLVPETSCEYFNKYLDRGFLIGTAENADVAFLQD
jgi:hypothetical protein